MITIPADWITYINIGLIALFGISMVVGASKGFLRQIVSLLGTILSVFAAWRYCAVVADYLMLWPREWTPLQDTLLRETAFGIANQAMWFVIIFAVCRIIILILESLLKEIESTPVIREISGLLGGAIGLVTGLVWVLIISVLLKTPFFANGAYIASHSWIGWIDSKVTETADGAGIELNSSEMIDRIYEEARKLDDADKEAVARWLEDQGFESRKDPDEH